MKKELYKVFQRAQAYISENYAAVLEQQDFDLIESYLAHFLEQGNVTVPGMERQAVLTRLVDEMTRYSFLTAYLDDPQVEEININAWDDVKVKYTDGSIRPAEEHFQTPEHARAVIRRVLGQSKMVWDNTQCIVVAHLPGNVRITAVGYDVLDEETALAVSIRKVNAQKLQKQDFIEREPATEDMLSYDLKQLELKNMKLKAQRRVPKLGACAMVLLGSIVLLFLGVLSVYIFANMGPLY